MALETIAGSLTGASGSTDDYGTAATFNTPMGLSFSSDYSTLYVADYNNFKVRTYDMNTGEVATLCTLDKRPSNVWFSHPLGCLYVVAHGTVSNANTSTLYQVDIGDGSSTALATPGYVMANLAGTGVTETDENGVTHEQLRIKSRLGDTPSAWEDWRIRRDAGYPELWGLIWEPRETSDTCPGRPSAPYAHASHNVTLTYALRDSNNAGYGAVTYYGATHFHSRLASQGYDDGYLQWVPSLGDSFIVPWISTKAELYCDRTNAAQSRPHYTAGPAGGKYPFDFAPHIGAEDGAWVLGSQFKSSNGILRRYRVDGVAYTIEELDVDIVNRPLVGIATCPGFVIFSAGNLDFSSLHKEYPATSTGLYNTTPYNTLQALSLANMGSWTTQYRWGA